MGVTPGPSPGQIAGSSANISHIIKDNRVISVRNLLETLMLDVIWSRKTI